jgi:hypothetical protein
MADCRSPPAIRSNRQIVYECGRILSPRLTVLKCPVVVDSIPEIFGRRRRRRIQLPNTNIVPTRNSKILCRRNAWEMNYLNRPRFRIGGISKRLSTAAAQDGTIWSHLAIELNQELDFAVNTPLSEKISRYVFRGSSWKGLLELIEKSRLPVAREAKRPRGNHWLL